MNPIWYIDKDKGSDVIDLLVESYRDYIESGPYNEEFVRFTGVREPYSLVLNFSGGEINILVDFLVDIISNRGLGYRVCDISIEDIDRVFYVEIGF